MRKKSAGSLNDHAKSSKSTAYQRGSQADGSPHYVFLYSDDDDDEEEESIQMESRSKNRQQPRKVEVIKVSLRPEDTLQALALRYRCTISELKRINNIHKENEIFAHRYIKVPVQPFSIFTEKLIDYESPSTSKENGTLPGQTTEPSTSQGEQSTNPAVAPVAPSTAQQSAGINDIILNSICEPLTKSVDCDNSGIENAETDQLLLSERNEPTLETSAIDSFKCSGADWGLSWTHLLCVFLLLGFAGPIIYIVYIAEELPHEKPPA